MIDRKKVLFGAFKNFLSRKAKRLSSFFGLSRNTLNSRIRNFHLRLVSLILLHGLSTGEVLAANKNDKVTFNIPRQRADVSLINFAEQADITLLFPLDKIAGKQTNSIIGKYSVTNALQILLKDTGLKTELSKNGQLSILIDANFQKTNHLITDNSATVAEQEKDVEETSANAETEVIEVRGIIGALDRAIDAKREANGVIDSISAENIGKFPDSNLAESLQRITGVSIDRLGGEGQLITVRGFGPQFNTVLINGRQMASENQSRAFSFDTIASELVKNINVHKTSTASLQSGGIGSTINVNTARPFAHKGFRISGSVKATYDDNSEKTTPQASAFISNTFIDDSLGVLFSVSHQERETRLNQAQMDGWLENVGVPNPQTKDGQAYRGNIFSPRNYDHKVTTEQRTRTNTNLVLQYAPSDKLAVTLDSLYSDFDVETDTTSYGHWFTAPNIEGFGDDAGATVDENGTVVDLYQEIGLATDMHAKKFDRLTGSHAQGLNFDWDVNDNLNMTFDFSSSTAKRAANNGRGDQLSLLGYANRVRFQLDNNILPYASEFSAANPYIYSGQQELEGVAYDANIPPSGVGNYLDSTNSRPHVMLRRGWAVEDNVKQFRWDSSLLVNEGAELSAIKFGVMYSSESKKLDRWDNERVGLHCTFCGYPDTPNINGLSQYVFNAGSNFLSGISGSGRMPTTWLAHDGEANFAFLEQFSAENGQPISFDAEKRNKSFKITENTLSLYAEFDFEMEVEGMSFSGFAGVRYEATDVDVDGTDEPISELVILDKTEMLARYGSENSITKSTEYEEVLPSVSAKLEINDELIARFAASKSITRPPLDSMSPVTVIGTTRQGGNLTSNSGNPSLKPFTSNNLDLSLEWYYADTSYISAGYFIKKVANFIINSTEELTFKLADGSFLTDPSTGVDVNTPDPSDDVAVFTNTLPNISESAKVYGWELALQHTFNNGFGLMVNTTIVDSDAELDPADITQVFALTGLSDSYNLIAFYEKGPFQSRIAYNWRGSFVQSLSQSNGDGVTIVEDYAQVDASGSFKINEHMSIFFEGINLTEEYVHKRGRFANQLLLIEDSGRRFSVGIRGTF